ncbi:hypothetical protein [Paenibacillus sp. GXUN7292]|uniref:hypothetical protein n=1 Tax=Paenibacillus sp. GXUN7292 TaxID=3422499 RepID=UPI003D7EB500
MTAENAYILSSNDIRRIRAYVQQKYAAVSGEKRAEIVADAVKKILYKQLPDFEENVKRDLLQQLLRQCVAEERRLVQLSDIDELCSQLDQNEPSIAAALQSWRVKQSDQLGGSQSEERSVKRLSAEAGGKVIPLPSAVAYVKQQRRKQAFTYSILFASLVFGLLIYGWISSKASDEAEHIADRAAELQANVQAEASLSSLNELPAALRYAKVNTEKLKQYLVNKSSLLADEPYFSAILQTAKDFDIHPALLFAITGQEQGFVPKAHKRAVEIANNPFNVFHSWKDYNTNITESSQIAARTINRLSKERPEHIDAFTWINREYAEDKKWADGVRSIYGAIIQFITNE